MGLSAFGGLKPETDLAHSRAFWAFLKPIYSLPVSRFGYLPGGQRSIWLFELLFPSRGVRCLLLAIMGLSWEIRGLFAFWVYVGAGGGSISGQRPVSEPRDLSRSEFIMKNTKVLLHLPRAGVDPPLPTPSPLRLISSCSSDVIL